MENVKSFFGENGLTSTSANHVANLCKEKARKLQAWLDGVSFLDESIQLLSGGQETQVSKGLNKDQVDRLVNYVNGIGALHSLIAFLREAIKEKENLYKKAKNWEDIEERERLDKLFQELDSRQPVRVPHIDEEYVVASWTIGQQQKYLSLQAMASAYGKFIHEDGSFSRAKRRLDAAVSTPVSISGTGQDTTIRRFMPSVPQDMVEKELFNMNDTYRSIQAELNGIKAQIDREVKDTNLTYDEEYTKAMANWNVERSKLEREQKLMLENEAVVRQQKAKEVDSLKIVIPKALQAVYDSVMKAE